MAPQNGTRCPMGPMPELGIEVIDALLLAEARSTLRMRLGPEAVCLDVGFGAQQPIKFFAS